MPRHERLLGATCLILASALVVAAGFTLAAPEDNGWLAKMQTMGGVIALVLALLAALPGIWLLVRRELA